MLAGGGYASFCVDAKELITLGHGYDVLVYPCINCGVGIYAQPEALRGAASNGMLQAVTLRMKFSARVKRALLHVRFNGLDLDSKAGTKSDPYWLELPLTAELVRQGLNDLHIALARQGPIANETMVLEQVWVVVRYR